jgi:hypothetical protein
MTTPSWRKMTQGKRRRKKINSNGADGIHAPVSAYKSNPRREREEQKKLC